MTEIEKYKTDTGLFLVFEKNPDSRFMSFHKLKFGFLPSITNKHGEEYSKGDIVFVSNFFLEIKDIIESIELCVSEGIFRYRTKEEALGIPPKLIGWKINYFGNRENKNDK